MGFADDDAVCGIVGRSWLEVQGEGVGRAGVGEKRGCMRGRRKDSRMTGQKTPSRTSSKGRNGLGLYYDQVSRSHFGNVGCFQLVGSCLMRFLLRLGLGDRWSLIYCT